MSDLIARPTRALPPDLPCRLADWFNAARPGDQVVYARGCIAALRGEAKRAADDACPTGRMLLAAAMAMDLEARGMVRLTQARLPDGTGFAYIATKAAVR